MHRLQLGTVRSASDISTPASETNKSNEEGERSSESSDSVTASGTISSELEAQKIIGLLKALKQLYDSGVLTEAEFQEKLNKLLQN